MKFGSMMASSKLVRFFSAVLAKSRRFPSAEMEKQFQGKQTPYIIQFSNFWLSLNVLLSLFLIGIRAYKLNWFKGEPAALGAHFIPLAILAAVFFALNFFPVLQPRCAQMLSLACILIAAWICWSLHFITGMDLKLCHEVDIPNVWAELSPTATLELQNFLTDQLTFKQSWFSLLHVFLFLNFLHFVGLRLSTIAVYLLFPIFISVTVYVSPVLSNSIIEGLAAGVVLLLYEMISGLYILITRREQFQVDYALQQALQNEARAMQELAQQELAQKESAQRADSILNHILKNTMADAAGCIHLFMETNGVKDAPDLMQALGCLDSGIKWSRKRQALYKVTSGNYVPMLAKVNLQELGLNIIRGRDVRSSFPDATVMLDPILCDIVLDNAIGNAFHHGCACGPDVFFGMQLKPFSPEASLLVFRVTNKADARKPPVTKEFVSELLGSAKPMTQHPVSALSDHLGLQHLYLAASAHGMTLTLEQVDDVVILEAALEVQRVAITQTPTYAPCEVTTQPFPSGLRILCLDDSAVARRLMSHILSQQVPNSTVFAYGADPEEIKLFITEALAGADILMLDNHLDYGDVSFSGADILSSLLAQGCLSFACIRSADVSDDTRVLYLENGAHCAIGKDASPQEMVAQLQVAYTNYCHWKTQQSSPPPGKHRTFSDAVASLRSGSVASNSSDTSILLLPGMVKDETPRCRSSGAYTTLNSPRL